MTTAYLDASALVKMAIEEPESVALRAFTDAFDELVTSRIGLIESLRATKRAAGAQGAVIEILSSVGPIELDAGIAATAAVLEPPALRTLDAIHVATALSLYALDAFVTYDTRLAAAARQAGFTVATPA